MLFFFLQQHKFILFDRAVTTPAKSRTSDILCCVVVGPFYHVAVLVVLAWYNSEEMSYMSHVVSAFCL